MACSKTIQLFIFDGDPNGRVMCELSNWSGRVYKVSRNELLNFGQRADAENTGVYLLFGQDDDANDSVYIGEAERIYSRLKQHTKDKDDWNECVVIISKDNVLNKAHVKYMENKFYRLANLAGRYTIVNSTVPTCSSISEYDEAMLYEFIENAKLLVKTLGYKVFDCLELRVVKKEDDENYFSIKAARGADAKGFQVSDGFAVLAGSTIASTVVKSAPEALTRQRNSLIKNGIIDESFQFTKDHIFTSPSTAATLVMGRSANGRIEWKTRSGKTIRELETELLG